MKLISTKLVPLSLAFVIFSCSPGKKGQDAEVGEAGEAADIEESATLYEVDTANSVVTWIGSKPTGQHNGTIDLSEGSIAVSNGSISGGTVILDIKSLEDKDLPEDGDNNAKLVGHLMSEDFFAADSFPTATFEIVEIKPYDSMMLSSDKEQFKTDYTPATMSEFMIMNPSHYITGNLTMRGITKSISFPASVEVTDTKVSAEAKFNIDRTDWKLMYGDEASVTDKAKDKFIYNTVNVGFNFVATTETM